MTMYPSSVFIDVFFVNHWLILFVENISFLPPIITALIKKG